MKKYQAIDGQQVIQASAVESKSVTPPAPLATDFTIISAETPQPTRQNFISRVYIILWFQLLVTSTFIGLCNQNKSVGISSGCIYYVVIYDMYFNYVMLSHVYFI